MVWTSMNINPTFDFSHAKVLKSLSPGNDDIGKRKGCFEWRDDASFIARIHQLFFFSFFLKHRNHRLFPVRSTLFFFKHYFCFLFLDIKGLNIFLHGPVSIRIKLKALDIRKRELLTQSSWLGEVDSNLIGIFSFTIVLNSSRTTLKLFSYELHRYFVCQEA